MKVYRVEMKVSGICPSRKHPGKVDRCVRMGPYMGTGDLPAKSAAWLYEHGMEVRPGFKFDETRHPSPYEDYVLRHNIMNEYRDPDNPDFVIKNYVLSNFLYGFESLESLDAWFDESIRAILHRAGYAVMVYEAKEMYAGQKQIVFEPNNAELIEMIQLTDVPVYSMLGVCA